MNQMNNISDQTTIVAEADVAHVPDPKPLITASEMFPALERMILSARTEVLLAFRIFDPRTRLHAPESHQAGLETFADLLHHVAERGLTIRLLMSDFDPVFTADLHRSAWDSAARFASRLREYDNAELICALHDCAPAPVWHLALAGQIRARKAQLRTWPGDRLTPLQLRALNGDYRLRPVTLHQKFAVIDADHAIIGGIDVDDRRWDTPDHDRRPEETWHDVSVEVSGPVVRDIRDHFAECWDRARSGCGTVFSAGATPLSRDSQVSSPPTGADTRPDMSLIRTVSAHRHHPVSFGPAIERRDHETAHLDLFAQAQKVVYIETQFLRHLPLARALAKRATQVPELQLILVVPTEPERIIFGRDNGMDARHAQALQIRCLDILRSAFGDRMAVVSPAQAAPAPDGTPMPVAGSGIIYLHSKVTLVDDRIGIVGSANLNGRSLLWDTEASLRFERPDAVRDLRLRLAQKWLGGAPGDPAYARTWAEAAHQAASQPPEARYTTLLPYPEGRNRRFARYLPIMPAAMF
ncbi:phospholipase D family protein [Pseudooceanicola sp. C21-150M6]|uniref:phospholipase D family protein n=1 Tax=Pseudooceanicola sp. C21-150M6 TaxID=3434355 RepID=UPI003D7F3D6D